MKDAEKKGFSLKTGRLYFKIRHETYEKCLRNSFRVFRGSIKTAEIRTRPGKGLMVTVVNNQIFSKIAPSIVLLFIAAAPALAHRATVFAWVEGDTVHTESKFSGGKYAKNAPIEVFDDQGLKLLEGRTNQKGEFSFTPPRQCALKIVLNAGMGHKGSWTISADEFGAVDADVHESPEIKESTDIVDEKKMERESFETDSGVSDPSSLKAAELERIIERALDKKLQPVVAKINKSMEPDSRPSISDILGGIGYIFGLAGVGAYVNYRKKINGKPSS